MIKGIIYDMDDVMTDSYPLCYKASVEVLKEYNFSLDKIPERVRAGFIGMRVMDVAKIIVNYAKVDLSPEEYFNRFASAYDRIRAAELTALPGLIDSLSLFKQGNFKIALGSSGIKSYIDFVLDKFNLRSYFDAVVAGDQVKKGKPDPEVYEFCAMKLGLKTSECVVFEDAAVGIAAAKAAGCKCIAIINHHIPRQDLSKADMKINSLAEVNLDIIKLLNYESGKNYLGIDWGEKRIGLALADSETKLATPFKTVGSAEEVARVVEDERIDIVVVGQPVRIMDYELRITNEKYNEFIKDLQDKIKIPVELVDERLSSKAADALVGDKKTKANRDEIAAMLILQSYLDTK